MSIVTVTGMNFGNGVRFNDTGVSGMSFVRSTVGAADAFAGPVYSFGARLRKRNLTANAACTIGFTTSSNSNRRINIAVNVDTGANTMEISLHVHTTDDGEVEVLSHTVPETTTEFSVAATYDEDGYAVLYLNGVEVDREPVATTGIGDTAAAGDRFRFVGGPLEDAEALWEADNLWFSSQLADPVEVLDIHLNGLAGYA